MLEATPELAGELDIGDIIVGKVSLIPLEEALDSGERIRSTMADGIHSYGELTACEVVGQRSFPVRKAIESLRLRLREFILRTLGSESGGLFLALFAADRSYLDGKLSLDFRRIGISHLLALSGMHLAILSFFIHRLLSLLHIKKMARTVIVMLFVILYMFFTGFPLSVVRAGVMLFFVSLYYLLALPRDSLTVL
jgi:predicted membrane metal-binding protein